MLHTSEVCIKNKISVLVVIFMASGRDPLRFNRELPLSCLTTSFSFFAYLLRVFIPLLPSNSNLSPEAIS